MERHAWLSEVEVEYLLLARQRQADAVAAAEREFNVAMERVTKAHDVPPATTVEVVADHGLMKLEWKESLRIGGVSPDEAA
jgi:hypothetical protein